VLCSTTALLVLPLMASLALAQPGGGVPIADGQRIVMVTGSTDGLGREVARRLAAQGDHVIVHGRNVERGRALVDEIAKSGKGSARFYAADFASLDAVRTLADDITRDYPRVDVLINNAGVWVQKEQGRRTSADGHEMHFAVNYLAPYLLTHRLLPLIEKGRTPRIINVSSRAQQPIDFADVMVEQGYDDVRARSKLAQILFTVDLAEALASKGIPVYAMHPSSFMNTPMVLSRGAAVRSSVHDGVAAVMHVLATDVPSGTYFSSKEIATPHAQAADPEARRQLRELSQRLTGVPTTSSASQRIVMVTGSTDGLGREVARRLAAQGDHVIVHGRNAERGRALVDEIAKGGKGSARFYAADFASLDAVRRLADEITRDYDRLDVLVNNAGVWVQREKGRVISADGHELHFAVNYLAGYLLTHKLLPLLERGRAPRIVNVSSGAQRPIDFDDVMLERDYSDSRGYAQSKLAQILFTVDLAESLQSKGIKAYALHPATMMDTPMVLSRGAAPRSSVNDGTEAVLHAIATDAPSGTYFNMQTPATPNAQAADAQARARLRALSRQLTGVP
jgi:NAD(P)-dependent dehydrogenase (short-subunit alcohol dehydrogenase family)